MRRPGSTGWLGAALLLALASRSAHAQTRYIAFGDSITFGIGDDTSRPLAELGYPGRLDDLLASRGVTATIANAGLPAEATAEAVTRIDEVLRTTPGDVLLLMEGTNDINAKVSVETVDFNLDRMADKAIAAGLRVVQATILPRLPSANTDGNNRTAELISGAVRSRAWTEGRALVDPFEVFLYQTPNALTTLYVGGDDKLHPNAAGYAKLAEVFADVLTTRDTVPPVLGAVSPADGATDVPASSTIRVSLLDFGTGIDLPTTRLVVNGQEVPALVSGDARRAEIAYTPAAPLVGVISVGFRSRDQATTPNTVDRLAARFIIAGTTFLTGDIDENGRVDGADLVPFAVAFGARRGETRYRRFFDFDGNDVIDGLDLAQLAANFGQRSF